MKKLFIQDKATFKTTARTITEDGFLSVPGRIARTGTQQYLASELGLKGNDTITVYRPPEEVFATDSLETYAGADLTVWHPKQMVNADNYKQTTVGTIRSQGRQDGDFVVADILIKDSQAIKQVQDNGFAELSAGYTAEYVKEQGVTDDGTPYDYVQRKIRINHVALLPQGAARAGRNARIFDDNLGETMTKVTLDNGRTVELQDEATAALVSDCIERLTQQVKDADKTADIDKMQATIDSQAEQLEALKQQTSDDAIQARISEVVAAKDSAQKIAGETIDSLDVLAIQKAALAKARPSVDWDSKSEAYIQAAFDMALETKPTNDEQLKQLTQDAAVATKPKQSAFDAYTKQFLGE